jgi:uncharacterized protein
MSTVGLVRSVVRGADWTSAALFVVLTYALSWTVWLGLGALGVPFTVRAAIGMFGPAAAALLVRAVRREGFADIGLRLSRGGGLDRAYAFALVGIPLLVLAGLLLAMLDGRQHWALLEQFRSAIGGAAAAAGRRLPPAEVILAIQVVAALTVAPLINLVFAAGEEVGWRGHLLVRLLPMGGPAAAVVTGVVWGLWHAPLIFLDGYEYGLPHRLVGPLLFCLFTVPLSVVLSWLRLRSGSVWPAALAHGALNAQAGLVLLALTPDDRLIAPPVGLTGIIPFAALAVWLVATGRLTPPREAPRDAA